MNYIDYHHSKEPTVDFSAKNRINKLPFFIIIQICLKFVENLKINLKLLVHVYVHEAKMNE